MLEKIYFQFEIKIYFLMNNYNFFFFKIYLRKSRSRGGRGRGKGRSRVPAEQGAQRGTRSQVSRITPQAEGGAKPLSHPGCPRP